MVFCHLLGHVIVCMVKAGLPSHMGSSWHVRRRECEGLKSQIWEADKSFEAGIAKGPCLESGVISWAGPSLTVFSVSNSLPVCSLLRPMALWEVLCIVYFLPGHIKIICWRLCRLSLEKEMAAHSRIFAWKIPWTAEPGRLLFMGSQRVGHDWATSFSLHALFRSYFKCEKYTSLFWLGW